MWNILREWCSSNISKFLEKTCKGVYFLVKLQTRSLLTALLKNYVLHSYIRTILLKVWVITYCIQAINFLMSGGHILKLVCLSMLNLFCHWELGLTKNKLWKVNAILKNRCCCNSKTCDVPKHRSTFTTSRNIHRELFLQNS